MKENNSQVTVEAIIDNSSLTNIQKLLAKKKFEIRADMSLQDFAKSKAELEKQIQKLASEMQETLSNAGVSIDDSQAGEWANEYYETIVSSAEKFDDWGVASSVLTTIIEKMKEAAKELKELDAILTQIGNTNTALSASDLQKIGENAFTTASKYGKTASDYLAEVQEASRVGYENIEGMAELSLAAQVSGDMTAELANQYIIATDQAYQFSGSVEKLTEVLDGANNITNHNTVNMTELAEGMSVVGTQAALSQMEIDETTAAIATMIAVTRESGSEVGNAFNGILMNLRQVTGEVNDGGNVIDEESLANYQKACEALGVSLTTVKDGAVSLKEPMQILKELSEAYTMLDASDEKRVNLLDAVGGDNRGDALNAILENYSLYEEMVQQYANGTGSMAVEAEKAATSWEGSLNRLSNTWTDTVGNITNSEAIVAGINGLNNLLTVINNVTNALGPLGTMVTIGSGFGIAEFVKNFA